MKFSRATTLIVLCAVSCLVVLPSVANAQSSKPEVTIPVKTTIDETTSTTSTVSKTTTQRPSTTSTSSTTAPARTTTPPISNTKPLATSSNPIAPSAITPPVPTSTGGIIGATCANSDACGSLLCVLTPASPTVGTCQTMPVPICAANPPLLCTKNADCTAAYSLCADNKGTMMCLGLGTPGSDDYCPNQNPNPKTDDGSLTPTIRTAGIAVGCVAALGLLFAGVRWQRRRQRSKAPENMFGEIDYGMTDRSAPKSAEQNYPFSSRPYAHGSDHAPSPPHDNGGYDNQYYDDGYQKDQYYGNDQYNSNKQYYGNQQDNYGYDHHSGHGGQGGQGGFYDNVDYNDYPQNGGHHSPIATPAAAVRSPRQNNYGAEPSELDYGGHGGNGGYGHGGHGGHGGQGGQGGQGGYY